MRVSSYKTRRPPCTSVSASPPSSRSELHTKIDERIYYNATSCRCVPLPGVLYVLPLLRSALFAPPRRVSHSSIDHTAQRLRGAEHEGAEVARHEASALREQLAVQCPRPWGPRRSPDVDARKKASLTCSLVETGGTDAW